MQVLLFTIFLLLCQHIHSQYDRSSGFWMADSVRVMIDRDDDYSSRKRTVLVFYALPNGNTTEQTMGKKLKPGDDWHFDIQHIRAQTAFLRNEWKDRNLVVIYLENNFKSWPLWKQRHPDFKLRIPQIVDSLSGIIPSKRKEIYLNGHSGGGSFIFGYLAGIGKIPKQIKRISFLDSNYGYDSSYYPILNTWLQQVRDASLNVFAYNDSIALHNGKPVVSAKGGTWYRGHLMLAHFSGDRKFRSDKTDSLTNYKSTDKRIQFFFKGNLNRGIYHTQQVELNGFIHSILCGTKLDSKNYTYYGDRAYKELIKD